MQSALVGKRLKNIHFDNIICSELNRAKETLDVLLKYSNIKEKNPKVNVTYDSRVNERYFGVFEGSKWGSEFEVCKVSILLSSIY